MCTFATRSSLIALSTFIGAVGLCPYVQAQTTPLHISTTAPVVDEFEQRLEGTHEASADFGVPYVAGDLVQVLNASLGVYPPDTTGVPHPLNPTIRTARIGEGVSPTHVRSAQFACSLVDRPSTPVFIRLFNASTLAEASFYTDSEVFTAGTAARLFPKLIQTDQPLDSEDSDNDGLHNSWEKSLGTDSEKADTDGDGVSDGEEHFAGTSPVDDSSLLIISGVSMAGADTMLTWQSIAGDTYDIQCTLGDIGSSSYTTIVATVVATGSLSRIALPTPQDVMRAVYRVARSLP